MDAVSSSMWWGSVLREHIAFCKSWIRDVLSLNLSGVYWLTALMFNRGWASFFLERQQLSFWQVSEHRYEETLEIRTQCCITFPEGEKIQSLLNSVRSSYGDITKYVSLVKYNPSRKNLSLENCFISWWRHDSKEPLEDSTAVTAFPLFYKDME